MNWFTTLIDLWLTIVPRMTLGVGLSMFAVTWIVHRWPAISAEWRHRLWCGVVLQGLLWFTIPLTWTEVVTVAADASAPDEERRQDAASTGAGRAVTAEMSNEDSLSRAFAGSSATGAPIDLARVTFLAWLAIVATLAIGITVQYVQFTRLLTRASWQADEAVQGACELQARRLDLSMMPEVRVSPLCEAPFVIGLVRPVVFLPETLSLQPAQRDALLAHELAHVKRRDAAIEVAALAACLLNFFNPLIWRARRQLAVQREVCADRAVVRAAAHSPGIYAQALLQVAESLAVPSRAMALSSGRSAGELRARIEALLAASQREIAAPARWALGVLLLVGVGSLVTVHRQSVVLAAEPASTFTGEPLALAPVPLTQAIQAIPFRHEELSKGLKYLATQQREDGSLGPEGHGQSVGVVGLSGLAFLASGSKPDAGEYRVQITRAMDFVQKKGSETGYMRGDKGSMYDHGFATLFLARAYPLMEEKAELKKALENAVKVIVDGQCQDGSWRYTPDSSPAGDLTLGACEIAALAASQQAGFKVPQETFDRFAAFLKQAQTNEGSYRYTLGGGAGTPIHTAVGICSGQLAGMSADDLRPSLNRMGLERIAADAGFRLYGQWYAAQAMRRVGGEKGMTWYRTVADELCKQQSREGSWNEGESSTLGTALGCLILASPVFEVTGKK